MWIRKFFTPEKSKTSDERSSDQGRLYYYFPTSVDQDRSAH